MWSFPPGNVFPPMIFFQPQQKNKSDLDHRWGHVCLINTKLRAHHFCLKESEIKHHYLYSTNPKLFQRVVLRHLASTCLAEDRKNLKVLTGFKGVPV